MKKTVVTYRNFHDINRDEIFPEVFLVPDGKDECVFLEEMWKRELENSIEEGRLSNDPVDKEKCWHDDDRALITWADGDTKEYYIVEVG